MCSIIEASAEDLDLALMADLNADAARLLAKVRAASPNRQTVRTLLGIITEYCEDIEQRCDEERQWIEDEQADAATVAHYAEKRRHLSDHHRRAS